jgi:NAD-dependent deacetylase
MDFDENLQAIETAARLIKEARMAVIFTGAGLSTPSGIPDFRGSTGSLWSKDNPMEVASLSVFYNQPERFFNWFYPLARHIAESEPNDAHIAIAKLQEAGYFQAVITQNIDRLHQGAGSNNVLELHGAATSATCLYCGAHYEAEQYLPAYLIDGAVPHCEKCNEVIKPDIVLFEEQLPAKVWTEAEELCKACDLIFVAGSSLEVVPAATLPVIAVRNGAHLIINNQNPTQMDELATLTIHQRVELTLPAIARILL